MAASAAVDLGYVHGLLIDEVRKASRIRLRELVDLISGATRTNSQQVTAAVWDLVQEDRLRYDADAYVSLTDV